ncbi:MAG: hypothetical protein ABGZ23_00870 [Fuerstiella sp.]
MRSQNVLGTGIRRTLSTFVSIEVMKTRSQDAPTAANMPPPVRSIQQEVADLLICVEEIDRRLSDSPNSERWQWRSRRNVAVFLLNRLANEASDAGTKLDVRSISPEQRRRVLSDHPLVGPLSEYSPDTSTAISSLLGQHIRERVNHLQSS